LENIDASPGLCNAALKVIADNNHIYDDVCLVLDGMHIKKMVSVDHRTNQMFGFVDVGDGPEKDEATEVLVFMVVSLKLHGRIPIAYFLINGITADQLKELVITAISALHCRGCTVRVVTMDGAATNISMIKELGCNIGGTACDTSFHVPGEKKKYQLNHIYCGLVKYLSI
jgi:hypothetical protein